MMSFKACNSIKLRFKVLGYKVCLTNGILT